MVRRLSSHQERLKATTHPQFRAKWHQAITFETNPTQQNKKLNNRRTTMSTSHKPNGYTTVSPYLIVDGAARTIEFLVKVFDAVKLRQFPDATGKLRHAEVRIDDCVIMMADGGENWPPIPSYVHVYVKDVDETYKRALEAGAVSVQAPVKKDDEDKRGGVKDAGGTTWWIATKVE
jgi:PhnB protein